MKNVIFFALGLFLISGSVSAGNRLQSYTGAQCEYQYYTDSTPWKGALSFKNTSGASQHIICPIVRGGGDIVYGDLWTNSWISNPMIWYRDINNDTLSGFATDAGVKQKNGLIKYFFSMTPPSGDAAAALTFELGNNGNIRYYSVWD